MIPRLAVLGALGTLGCSGGQPAVFAVTDLAIPDVGPLSDDQVNDVLLQTVAPAVDVLWIVEWEAGSDIPLSIQASAPLFLEPLIEAEVDFRVGLSVEGSGLLYVDATTENPADLVGDYLLSPVAPEAPPPHPIDATNDALEAMLSSRKALGRSDVPLHVLVVSDVEDPKRTPTAEVATLTTWLSSLLPPGDLSLSGITGPTVAESFDPLRAVVGGRWSEVTTVASSTEWVELSAQATGLRREFFLSTVPERDSLQVSVEAPTDDDRFLTLELDESDYAYHGNRNAIVLSNAPSAGSRVLASYRQAGSPSE